MGIEARIFEQRADDDFRGSPGKARASNGDRIAFIETGQGYLIIPRNRPVDILFGALAEYAIPGTTTDDYDRAVGEGVSDHVEGPIRGEGR